MPRKYTMKQPRTPKQLEGLQPNKAEGTSGKTVKVTGAIDPTDLEALDSLPGTRSEKIRQAIREYIVNHQPETDG